jgi:hypothetical protein
VLNRPSLFLLKAPRGVKRVQISFERIPKAVRIKHAQVCDFHLAYIAFLHFYRELSITVSAKYAKQVDPQFITGPPFEG